MGGLRLRQHFILYINYLDDSAGCSAARGNLAPVPAVAHAIAIKRSRQYRTREGIPPHTRGHASIVDPRSRSNSSNSLAPAYHAGDEILPMYNARHNDAGDMQED